MGMTWLLGSGHHRKTRRKQGTPVVQTPAAERIVAEPACGDMTIDELRRFLYEVDAVTGPGLAGHLRPQVAVRFSGAIKGIWVKLPRQR